MRCRVMVAVLLAAVLAGCESPPAPSTVDGVPQVAGTYSGELELRVPDAPGGPQRGFADFEVVARQDARLVTLTATLTWPGDPPNQVWDGVDGTIDEDGVFHAPPPNDYDDPDCGRVRYGRRLLQFRGDTFIYESDAQTARCGLMTIDATLHRR